ncbi:MAG TPA: hypothetical protein VFW73_00500 [Lacipirellulaceae bacterium]|nr:hypothetical protein [Lacipirellulaceae bacterium]
MTVAVPISSDEVRQTFRAWNAERDSLEAQLNESLAALSAYQSHLDGWQKQLAHERDELRTSREQIERDRVTTDKSHAESSAAMSTELNAAREKITALTTLLLNRTEELRTLDNRRAEVQTELELSRARERELKAVLDEHQSSAEQERSEWSEELRQLREVLEREVNDPPIEEPVLVEETTASAPKRCPAKPPATKAAAKSSSDSHLAERQSPVLGSIVEQFGKLRQQRAVERRATNKSR